MPKRKLTQLCYSPTADSSLVPVKLLDTRMDPRTYRWTFLVETTHNTPLFSAGYIMEVPRDEVVLGTVEGDLLTGSHSHVALPRDSRHVLLPNWVNEEVWPKTYELADIAYLKVTARPGGSTMLFLTPESGRYSLEYDIINMSPSDVVRSINAVARGGRSSSGLIKQMRVPDFWDVSTQ